jgi:uncharacterized RDD family membrane protein YckC
MNIENPNNQNSNNFSTQSTESQGMQPIIGPNTSPNQFSNKTYAKIYSRLASFLIDALILSIPTFIVFMLGIVIFSVFIGNPLNLITQGNNTNPIGNQLTIKELEVYLPIFSLIGILFMILLSSVVPLLYYAYFQSKTGQTWGMRIVGIKIIKEDGSLLSFNEAFARFFIYSLGSAIAGVLSYVPVVGGILSSIASICWSGWCLYDKKKQNLYDKIFNNIYVSENEKTTISKVVVGCYFVFLVLAMLLITAVAFYIFSSFMKYQNFQVKTDPNMQLQTDFDMNLELKTDNPNSNLDENITNELYISPKVDTVSAVVSYQQCQNQELLNSDQSLISKCECLVNTVVNEKVTDPQVILNKCQVDILK